MSVLLDSVNALKANVEQAHAIFAQLTPLKAVFDVEEKNIAGIDRSKTYFGINADGTATLLSFDPSNGVPKFDSAVPLPDEPVLASALVPAPVSEDIGAPAPMATSVVIAQ
jgi:hypothetical protein